MKIIKNNITLLVITVYILSVFLISPWGNYALADDYYYLVQIKAFSSGELIRSALIGPTFLSQNFLSVAWGNIFGFTYLSLRILTIFISILCIFLVGKISDSLNIDKRYKLMLLVLLAFNPFFYSCSLNLMTENYFLFFLLSSLYFFLLYILKSEQKNLFISTLLGGLSITSRQYGFVLFPVYILSYFFKKGKNYKYSDILRIFLPVLIFGSIGLFWPKYSSVIEPKSTSLNLFFASVGDIKSKIFNLNIFIYISYFLMPISFAYLNKLKKINLLLIIFFSLPLAYFVFTQNLFNIGNLFYLEGLQARLRPNIRDSVFNNIPFKLFLAYLISLSFTTNFINIVSSGINYIILKKKNIFQIIKEHDTLLLFGITTVGFYLIVVITEAYFDRYFINFFVFLTIFGILFLKRSSIQVTYIAIVVSLLMSFITYGIVFDYHSENKLKWSLANKINSEYGVKRYDIFIDQIYASTIQMEDTDNFKGFYPARPQNYNPTCFVQEYSTQNENNVLYKLIKFFQNKSFVQKYFKYENLDIDSWNREKRNKFDVKDRLFYDEKYISPIYNLIGKSMYVRAFCTNEVVPETGLEPASL